MFYVFIMAEMNEVESEGATLVTGASSGIGRALAEEFAREGNDVVLSARREDRLESLAAVLEADHGVTATAMPTDLSDSEAAVDLRERIEDEDVQIDTLVNNAGYAVYGRFHETSFEEERKMLQVNLLALTELTKEFLPQLLERGGGNVLNVASIAGVFPAPTSPVYAATKAYTLSFSEALANDYAADGVTVTALCPGNTDTEFMDRGGVEQSNLPETELMSAEDVARAGYEGLRAGKAIVVPGRRNQLIVQLKRLLPRRTAVNIARGVWEG